MKKTINNGLKIAFPLLLGGAVLWWTYRGFDFGKVTEALCGGMDYGWMVCSLFFGVMSHVIRGWRWRQTLEPLGESPKTGNCVYAVFVAYVANLVVPRLGEVSRCGVLSRYDKVSFSKSFGTVLSERLVDVACIGLLSGIVLVSQIGLFAAFFRTTGTNFHVWAEWLTSARFYAAIACAVAVVVLAVHLMQRFAFFGRVRAVAQNVWAGFLSLRKVRNMPLFIFYTLAIWGCYWLHFYLAFFCFGFTASLGWVAGLVTFVVGSIAVAVPTPNGAGPWHFAVISMMTLYGVSREEAGIFALIVHGFQTLLIILLGIYGLAALPFTNKNKSV